MGKGKRTVIALLLGFSLLATVAGMIRALAGNELPCAGDTLHQVLAGQGLKEGSIKEVGVPARLGPAAIDEVPRPVKGAPCKEVKLAMVNSGTEGLLALHLRNPGNGCGLALVESGTKISGLGEDARFVDPCHGAGFTLEGNCTGTSGPCSRGLSRFELEQTAGKYAVDMTEAELGRPNTVVRTPGNASVGEARSGAPNRAELPRPIRTGGPHWQPADLPSGQ